MNINQIDPSPGIESAILTFPVDNYFGDGSYSFIIKAETLHEPRLLTTSCYKIPLFAIRADLYTSSGELSIMLGRADNSVPQSQVFLLPRYVKDVPDHIFDIAFQNWQIIQVRMDKIALQAAPIPTEMILIHQGVEQLVSAYDLLSPNGSMSLEIPGALDVWNGLSLFLLQSHNYEYNLFVDNGEIVLRRSGYEVRSRPEGVRAKLAVWISWSPTKLQVMLPNNAGQTNWSVITPVVVPPKSLYQLAMIKMLQPTTGFASVEAFRTAVHEVLHSLKDSITEFGAYNGFWDQRYQGKRKQLPTPKKETDIHRQLILPLNDWAKMRSVEIVPENETAVGKLDICFIGNIEGQGPVPFCVEVKLAHARDLLHGLEIQLPDYMKTKRAMYGAYVVLWFKGDWFGLPASETIHHLREKIVPGNYEPIASELDELEFALVSKTTIAPNLRNIRVFILDLSKPVSASKKK